MRPGQRAAVQAEVDTFSSSRAAAVKVVNIRLKSAAGKQNLKKEFSKNLKNPLEKNISNFNGLLVVLLEFDISAAVLSRLKPTF